MATEVTAKLELEEGVCSIFEESALSFLHDDWSSVDKSVLRTFFNDYGLSIKALQAIIEEDIRATKLQITTKPYPLPSSLAAKIGTCPQTQYILSIFRFKATKAIYRAWLNQAHKEVEELQALNMEHKMLIAMNEAGVNPNGTPLGPIATEVRDRMARCSRRKNCVQFQAKRSRQAMKDALMELVEASENLQRQNNFWWTTRKVLWWFAAAVREKVRQWWFGGGVRH